ncbi:vWA domain-containing protein [Acetatifactor muris]|uniref:vWA domain-containing protein n=1 Tax=Acetatifactor muris TaxID=879566 RepID=UPI0023F13DED|nr:VWA domain-containing protein [Acetatifactor muris]
MAFNAKADIYKVKEPKKLPVILLLDVSGSMDGDKIDSLYDATVDMIESFAAAQAKEQSIDVAIITFGRSVELHTPYTPVKELQAKGVDRFQADGMTPMGTALKMAKDMIEDRQVTPSRIYRPAVVLVSDGEPNDDWKGPMDAFINTGRSMKCQRFAVAIGTGADRGVLERFTQDADKVFFAGDASDLSEHFRTISMTVSTNSVAPNSNAVPTPSDVKYDNDTESDADTGNMDLY